MNASFPPETYLIEPKRRHSRQAFWQIYLPLTVGFAIFLTLGIMVVVSQETGNPELSRWAAIAAIWIILPLLAFGIVALLFNFLLIFLFSKVNNALPDYGRLARFYTFRVAAQIQALANRLSSPAISLRSNLAGWMQIFTYLRKM
jgi:uncharacterized protein with PQ loop repeat